MTFKSHHHSWLCVWLSCVLSALLPASPFMLTMLPDEARCEESDPADTSEEVADGEVTLSESNSGKRRSRRELSGVRRALLATRGVCSIPSNLCALRPSPGQVSLWGRYGPMHC